MDSFKYFAFISYNHENKKEAKKLYRRLNYYRLPLTLRNEYQKKDGRILPDHLSPVFIDDEEMANASVMEGMVSGLERSRYLIVVCSPSSAKSSYVNSEVEYFIRNGRGDNIIPYIIEGKPCSGNPETECYPPAMRDKDRLGADVQELKEDAVLRVIATMLKVDMGVLAQREKKRREHRIISISALLIALVMAFAFYNDRMRSKIQDENLKFRISLSNQFVQTGEGFEQDGNIQEALMYYAKSLQTYPSNEIAKMNTLVALQKYGWMTAIDTVSKEDGTALESKGTVEAEQDLDSEKQNLPTSEVYGKLIGNDKFGYKSYNVYKKERIITLVPEDGGSIYQAEVPIKYECNH